MSFSSLPLSGPGLSVVAARPRPETTDAPYCKGKPTSRGSDSSRESLLASQRSVIDGGRESRSCPDRLPALPSANHRARKDEAHREIDEVSQHEYVLLISLCVNVHTRLLRIPTSP